MVESRWRRWIGMGVIAVVAVGSVATVAAGAGPRTWIPAVCPDGSQPQAAAPGSGSTAVGVPAGEAWFRLDPRLDRAGALEGQRLAIGRIDERGTRSMDLPAESFAAGPFGRIILVGTDDGTTSRLRAVDVGQRCAWDLASETDVIRRATIDPTGETIYEMRVDRGTRADLGIWTRPLDGSRPATPLLDPIAVDDRFGPTFSTEFAWALAGESLAIQSCGEVACRTRVVDRGGQSVQTVDEPGLGVLVGVDGQRLATYAACAGLPCPVISTDLSTGARITLADAAATAVLAATPDGPRLVHETFEGSSIALRSVALDGSSRRDLGRAPDGLRLTATTAFAGASTRTVPGWVLLSPDGSLPGDGPGAQARLRSVTDGTTVQLHEVAR